MKIYIEKEKKPLQHKFTQAHLDRFSHMCEKSKNVLCECGQPAETIYYEGVDWGRNIKQMAHIQYCKECFNKHFGEL